MFSLNQKEKKITPGCEYKILMELPRVHVSCELISDKQLLIRVNLKK